MTKLKGLLLIFPVWLLFIATNIFFQDTYMYWYVWWPDVLMHLWGGFLVVATILLLKKSTLFPSLSRQKEVSALFVLAVMMVVWELYEYSMDLTGPVGYVFDTSSDFVLGFIGGILAYYIFKSRTIEE